MILDEHLPKVAARASESGLVFKLKHLAATATTAVDNHPAVAVVASIASSLVALMQSAQEVVSTLIALVTSIAGLVVAIMALRSKWKNRNKSQE